MIPGVVLSERSTLIFWKHLKVLYCTAVVKADLKGTYINSRGSYVCANKLQGVGIKCQDNLKGREAVYTIYFAVRHFRS